MAKHEFSLFSGLNDKTPTSITLDQFEEMISGGEWCKQVLAVRTSKDPATRKANKTKLPAVTISGTFSGGHKASDLKKHSGLICMDFDLKDNPSFAGEVEAMRKKLAEDKYSKLVFVSVGGQGLAVVCEIDPAQHRESFGELVNYFQSEYGLVADKSCSDVCRLRFVSWDATARLNPQASRARVTGVLHRTKEKGSDTMVLQSYDSTVLCNSRVTRSITADKYTEAFEAKPIHYLYDRLVAHQFTARKGRRNSTLTQKLIPFLFGAVTESVAMEWAEAFYWYNAGIFNDPVEQHMAEAKAAWKSCEANYRDSLTESEKEYFDYISTRKKARHLIPLFRICRSLALVESDEFPSGVFAMSGKQCKLRLGLDHNKQGGRLLAILHNKYGVLEIESYGRSRSKDCPEGISNSFHWMIRS